MRHEPRFLPGATLPRGWAFGPDGYGVRGEWVGLFWIARSSATRPARWVVVDTANDGRLVGAGWPTRDEACEVARAILRSRQFGEDGRLIGPVRPLAEETVR